MRVGGGAKHPKTFKFSVFASLLSFIVDDLVCNSMGCDPWSQTSNVLTVVTIQPDLKSHLDLSAWPLVELCQKLTQTHWVITTETILPNHCNQQHSFKTILQLNWLIVTLVEQSPYCLFGCTDTKSMRNIFLCLPGWPQYLTDHLFLHLTNKLTFNKRQDILSVNSFYLIVWWIYPKGIAICWIQF